MFFTFNDFLFVCQEYGYVMRIESQFIMRTPSIATEPQTAPHNALFFYISHVYPLMEIQGRFNLTIKAWS